MYTDGTDKIFAFRKIPVLSAVEWRLKVYVDPFLAYAPEDSVNFKNIDHLNILFLILLSIDYAEIIMVSIFFP